MIEQWRPVANFFYEVSDIGRVRRMGAKKVLSQTPNKKGYMRVFLWRMGLQHTRYVHILVMQEFVGPVPTGHEVNHKDGVKTHNHLGNLEYLTFGGNNQHAWDTGLQPIQRKRSKFCVRGHLKVQSATEQKKHGKVTYLRCRECDRDRKRAKYKAVSK